MSPLIFTLVANILTLMINRGREQGIFIGVAPSSPSGGISILQYADDTLLFGRNDLEEALTLKWIVPCFELWSGLQIDFHESSLLPLGHSQMTPLLAYVFYCEEKSYPIRYLGFPLRLAEDFVVT